MHKTVNLGEIEQAYAARQYRRAQSEKMLDMFRRSRGRDATTIEELNAFMAEEIAAGRVAKGPIDPCAPEGEWGDAKV